MRGNIDWVEGLVVVEFDSETRGLRKSLFPIQVKSGDMVKIFDNEVILQKGETEKIHKEIEKLMKDIWED